MQPSPWDPTRPPAGPTPPVVSRHGETYFHWINGATFERAPSASVLERFLGEEAFEEDTLYIVLGTDSGLLPRFLSRRGWPQGSRYLFVEPEPAYQAVAPLMEAAGEGTRWRLATPYEWLRCARELGFDSYALTGRVRLLRSVGAAEGHLATYREAQGRLEREVQLESWRQRAQLGCVHFLVRHLENLADLHVPAARLEGMLRGRVGVLLAGGPSLDTLLPWVLRHRDKLVVAAVSRVARRLAEAGLVPDLFVSVDPDPESFDISKEMLYFSGASLLVHTNHVQPRLLAQWAGPAAFLGGRFPWPSGEAPNLCSTGPTVTNSAVGLLVAMGLRTLILAGVDLCYSPDGHTHARGSDEHEIGPGVTVPPHTVRTNEGHEAGTGPDFHNAIQVLAEQAAAARERGCDLVNPAPQAAAVPNVRHAPLEELERELERERPLAQRDMLRRACVTTAAQRRAHYRRARSEAERMLGRCAAAEAWVREALAAHRHFFRSGAPEARRRLDRIEQVLQRRYRVVTDLAKLLASGELVEILRPLEEHASRNEVERRGRLYYQGLAHGLRWLRSLLDDAVRRADDRLAEEAPEPDLERLVRRWTTDGQPGRARAWRLRRRETAARLPQRWQRRLRELEERHERELATRDTGHRRALRERQRLTGAAGQATELLHRGDAAGLRRMAGILARHPDAAAQPLGQLVAGYLAELEGRPDEAVAAYREADHDEVRELALRRLVILAMEMGDLDSAADALALLSELSLAYVPHLAELMRIRGRPADAIELYTYYLSRVPHDGQTLAALGRLYQDIGFEEGARWALDQATRVGRPAQTVEAGT